ncbi:MATE family efflux transporter [Rhizobium sp. EC-SD404]|uniref:MATE family efflux transporter n=1 Tax=Rhizobium sp. EC-SD404 TaxID=2038389 RepID=UPI0012554A46|nr:MATE family efflux transporter [Rhizobium sp. EC-SD404]VVT24079.1 putative multidrug resistance protein NorM [Rhizobium sp. EC-SD404]
MDTRVDALTVEQTAIRPGLTWAGHARASMLLATPLIGAQLGHMAINISDTVMVGWLGATELAATVLATQGFFLVFIFGVGFAQAVMPVAASAEGRGDIRGVRRSVRMGLWVLMLFAALVMLPMWHTETILLSLGQQPAIAALAGEYMRVAQWAMFPALIMMGLRSYLAVVGKAHVLMWATFVGVFLNIGLNYLFIFGNFGFPALGIVGAAVASLGTNLFGAAWLFWYTSSKDVLKKYELYVRFWRPDWPAFFDVVRLGWPIGLTIIAEAGLFAASSIMVGWLGTIPLAAHGIALQLASIAFMIPLGLSSAVTVRVGVAHGQRDWTGLQRAGWSGVVLAAAIGLAAAMTFLIIPGVLVGFYMDESNPNAAEVIAFAVPLLYVAAAFQIVDGIQAVAAGNLRGLKDTRMPMIIAIVSYWVIGLPAGYVFGFPLGFGAMGIWFGLAAGLTVAAVFLSLRFSKREQLGLIN